MVSGYVRAYLSRVCTHVLHLCGGVELMATFIPPTILGEFAEAVDATDWRSWRRFGTAAPGGCFVYLLYGAERGPLLYVGVTWNPCERWKRHAKTKTWWNDVRFAELVHVASDAQARGVETRLIRTMRPRHNKHQAVSAR